LDLIGDIAKTYNELAAVVLDQLGKLGINDLFFETGEKALRMEMYRMSCTSAEGQRGVCSKQKQDLLTGNGLTLSEFTWVNQQTHTLMHVYIYIYIYIYIYMSVCMYACMHA